MIKVASSTGSLWHTRAARGNTSTVVDEDALWLRDGPIQQLVWDIVKARVLRRERPRYEPYRRNTGMFHPDMITYMRADRE